MHSVGIWSDNDMARWRPAVLVHLADCGTKWRPNRRGKMEQQIKRARYGKMVWTNANQTKKTETNIALNTIKCHMHFSIENSFSRCIAGFDVPVYCQVLLELWQNKNKIFFYPIWMCCGMLTSTSTILIVTTMVKMRTTSTIRNLIIQ